MLSRLHHPTFIGLVALLLSVILHTVLALWLSAVDDLQHAGSSVTHSLTLRVAAAQTLSSDKNIHDSDKNTRPSDNKNAPESSAKEEALKTDLAIASVPKPKSVPATVLPTAAAVEQRSNQPENRAPTSDLASSPKAKVPPTKIDMASVPQEQAISLSQPEKSFPDPEKNPVAQTVISAVNKSAPSPESSQLSSSASQIDKPRYILGSKANPKPDYPMLARKKGWQGDVILGVQVAADGTIEHLTFVKSTDYGVLNYAAYETVRNHWRFDPLNEEKETLSAYIEVPISFRFN